jgi:hypothetical protein
MRIRYRDSNLIGFYSRGVRSRRKWMTLNDSLALAYNDPLVGRDPVGSFCGALRPADGAVRLAERAQTK